MERRFFPSSCRPMLKRPVMSTISMPSVECVPVRKHLATRRVATLALALTCIVAAAACSDPISADELSDFMILSPGDYYYGNPVTIRPSAASTDSVLVRWEKAAGAETYTILFSQVQTRDSLTNYLSPNAAPTFTIPVAAPQSITIPYGVPNPALDTIPVAQYPALQYVLKLKDLDALVANQPKGSPLYYLWSIEAHKGSKTARSIELHRLIIIRS